MTRAALSREQIETIKATFALSGNLSSAARAAGCSKTSARKYVKTDDEFSAMRAEKTAITIERVIEKCGSVQDALLDMLVDDNRRQKATMQEVATAFGIVTDKRQLLSGDPTTRTEHVATDVAARLTPEEMEQAARIRERLASEARS